MLLPAMRSALVLDIGVPAGLAGWQQEYRRHRGTLLKVAVKLSRVPFLTWRTSAIKDTSA